MLIHSILDDLPKDLSTIQRSEAVTKLMISNGMRWDSYEKLFQRIKDILQETEDCVLHDSSADIDEKLGYFLFSAITLFAYLNRDAESSLQAALQRVERKIMKVEEHFRQENKSLSQITPEESAHVWLRTKA